MAFTFAEPIAKNFRHNLPDSLRIDRSLFPEATLIRLLTGTLDFTHLFDGFSVSQRANLTNSLGSSNATVSSKTVKACIAPMSHTSLDAYLTRAGGINRAFYNNVLTEYCFFFYHKMRGNHTSAFVHLYRTLEFISYSFPLIHASTNRNYYRTYDEIRSYFSGTAQSELKFLRTFTNKLFENDPILQTTMDFSIVAQDLALQGKIYNTFKRIFGSDVDVQFDDALKKFTMPHKKLIDATVTLRNRFFHFATGGYQDNVSSYEVDHPDSFFENFNLQAATWVSIIYFEMLKGLCA